MESNERIINRVFSEIIQGYSTVKINNVECYIKHFDVMAESVIENIKNYKFTEGIKRGLLTEENKLDILIKNDLWKEEREKEVIEIKEEITILKSNLKVAYIPSQIKPIREKIDILQESLHKIYLEKSELLGMTAEKYAEKSSSNHYICTSLFKDKFLKNPLFTLEEFNELDTEDLNKIVSIFNESIEILNEINIKRVSCSNVFQNMFSLAESSYEFLGKPVAFFTFYQTSLLSYGNNYKYILANVPSVPDEFRNDPEKLEELFTSTQNINKMRQKTEGKNIEIFGATPEDLKSLGVDTSKQDKLDQMILENGEMDMAEMRKHGFI